MDEDQDTFVAAGMDAFLSKPIRASELLALLNSLESDNGNGPAESGNGRSTQELAR